MVVVMTESYDVLDRTVLGEERMGVTETNPFDASNRAKPTKR